VSRRTQTHIVVVVAALMVISYSLPWLVAPGVSLSANAYDLAEWSSLHPAARAESPPLLTALLLRLPLACIALILAFGAPTQRTGRILCGLGALALVVALLPPLEFVRATDDPNYRQQFALAVAALFGSLIGLSGILRRSHRAVLVLVLAVGAAASLGGLARGNALFNDFEIAVSLGAGGVLLALLLMLGVVGLFIAGRGQETRQPSV
jgi:hypothetical protein